jgi:hypothetical protein
LLAYSFFQSFLECFVNVKKESSFKILHLKSYGKDNKTALIQMSLPNKEETIQEKKKEGYQTGSLL